MEDTERRSGPHAKKPGDPKATEGKTRVDAIRRVAPPKDEMNHQHEWERVDTDGAVGAGASTYSYKCRVCGKVSDIKFLRR